MKEKSKVKNVAENVTKRGRVENLTPFTKDRQPTGEQKSRGWDRKRQAQIIMDKIVEYSNMSVEELNKLRADIKSHPSNHTIQEMMFVNYAINAANGGKLLTDWMDRNISKAPQDVQLSGADGKDLEINLNNYTKDQLYELPNEELNRIISQKVRNSRKS